MVKIFVGRLPEDAVASDLEDLFKEYGEVMDCCVLKGYAFVHMTELEEAKKAITELDKTELKGSTINVELSTTRVQKATKLFVGNLPEGTKSAEIHKLFKQHGTVIECDVVKNFAFVHMSKETMAREAIKSLDKTEFNGNVIAVQFARQRPEDMGNMFGGGFHGRGGGFNMGFRGGMNVPPRFMRRPMHNPYMGMGPMGGMRNGGGMMRQRFAPHQGPMGGYYGSGGFGPGYGGGEPPMYPGNDAMMSDNKFGRNSSFPPQQQYNPYASGNYDYTEDSMGFDASNGFAIGGGMW